MTTEAIDNAVTKLTNALEAGIKAVGALGEKYGPEVIDSGLWVVRVNGINNVASNLAGAAIGGVAAYTLWRLISRHVAKVRTQRGESFDLFDCDPLVILFGGLAATVATLLSVVCATHLADMWDWVAIFEPKLWIAKRLLGL